MADALRLRGTDCVLKIIKDNSVVDEITAIGSFNDQTMLETKEDGFLGEPLNRFDDIVNGFGGDMEIQLTTSSWHNLQDAIVARAKRAVLGTVFNIVRTDTYPNGDTAVVTYKDVKWGAQPLSISSRADFVKVKLEFKTSDRTVQVNAVV